MLNDYIEVDDEYYDPYHILGVTKDDTVEHVKNEYKKKAKKYHPDKAKPQDIKKYQLRFRIIKKAYEYVKSQKQSGTLGCTNIEKACIEDTEGFRIRKDTSERTKNVKEYEEFNVNIVNQFLKKKFSLEEFNKLFDYNIHIQKKESKDNNELIKHKTTDGFFGYNPITNCANVSSYQGLLLTLDNDEIEESFKCRFNGATNPNEVIKVPKGFLVSKEVEKPPKELKSSESFTKKTFKQEEKALHDKILRDLLEKEEHDKKFIMKNSKKYSNDVIQKALRGELEMSPTLLSTLSEHYRLTY
jgi:hypothetical protein